LARVLRERRLHPLARLGARGVGSGGEDEREGLGTRLELRPREGGVVGGDDLLPRIGVARAADEHPHRQVVRTLHEVVEADPRLGHLLVAGEETRVEDHHPLDPVGVLDGEAQPDRTAPVVHHHGRAA